MTGEQLAMHRPELETLIRSSAWFARGLEAARDVAEDYLGRGFVERQSFHGAQVRAGFGGRVLAQQIDLPSRMPQGMEVFDSEAHTGFEPVLREMAGDKPDSGSRGEMAPGSELNPHLRAVLERLKTRDREKRRR